MNALLPCFERGVVDMHAMHLAGDLLAECNDSILCFRSGIAQKMGERAMAGGRREMPSFAITLAKRCA